MPHQYQSWETSLPHTSRCTGRPHLVLRNAPLAYLAEEGLVDKKLLAKAEENALLLCAGQGSYEGDALVDTQAMADALTDCGLPVQ